MAWFQNKKDDFETKELSLTEVAKFLVKVMLS